MELLYQIEGEADSFKTQNYGSFASGGGGGGRVGQKVYNPARMVTRNH